MDSFITCKAALLAKMISLWILVVCQEQAKATAYLSVKEHQGEAQGRSRPLDPQDNFKKPFLEVQPLAELM